jgi:hypothetical protein
MNFRLELRLKMYICDRLFVDLTHPPDERKPYSMQD